MSLDLQERVVEDVARWIKAQSAPVTVEALMAHTDWSRRTVSRRTFDLVDHGIRHERVPGSKSEWRYGSDAQWVRFLALERTTGRTS